ncbi:hypothetical protein AX17_006010 [Amanita inopinata Kibby_2008]|nr:hypothetical protein AX17_006010 [Amanita inopinata Kibby_2008]
MDAGVAPLYIIHTTPYGGRGAYAQTHITTGTCILHCPAPYAFVISRKFKKEVCAWCFKYAFEHGKNTWGWRYEAPETSPPPPPPPQAPPIPEGGSENGGATGKGRRMNNANPLPGVWFCSSECRTLWCSKLDAGGLHAILNATLEKLASTQKERGTADSSTSAAELTSPNHGAGASLLKSLEKYWVYSLDALLSAKKQFSPVPSDSPIPGYSRTLTHREELDIAWRYAEVVYAPKRRNTSASKHPQLVQRREESLNDFELDSARFVISALVRRFLEENEFEFAGGTRSGVADDSTCTSLDATWSDVLRLQDNEIETALRKPEITASHLRVYGFVRRVVDTMLSQARPAGKCSWDGLRTYVDTSDAIRTLLARDHGNVFGIWDMAPQADSEMLGWGLYVQGSYFNHDCNPNVKKQRSNRAMAFFAMRDIEAGEELCTTYIDVNDPVLQRRKELKEEWYFDCACARCQKELKELGSDTDSIVTLDEGFVDSGYMSLADD